MSRKRVQIKKNARLQTQLNKMSEPMNRLFDTQEETAKNDQEIRNKRKRTKNIAHQLRQS